MTSPTPSADVAGLAEKVEAAIRNHVRGSVIKLPYHYMPGLGLDGVDAAVSEIVALVSELDVECQASMRTIADERLNYAGAMSDLDSALEVLIRRINGEADLASAAEWVRLNYPRHAARLSPAHQGEEG